MIRFGLTPTQMLIFNLLMTHPVVSRQMIAANVLGYDKTPGNLDVQICKMRKHLKAHGITIRTRHSVGWFLTLETKARVKGMILEQEAA